VRSVTAPRFLRYPLASFYSRNLFLFYTSFEVPSMHPFPSTFLGLLLSLKLSLSPASAFETNLSEEAVREV